MWLNHCFLIDEYVECGDVGKVHFDCFWNNTGCSDECWYDCTWNQDCDCYQTWLKEDDQKTFEQFLGCYSLMKDAEICGSKQSNHEYDYCFNQNKGCPDSNWYECYWNNECSPYEI